jgi:hypothetical protein
MNIKHNTSIQKKRGFTLLVASLIASVLLALALFMISIAQKEVILSTFGRDSQYAFYVADAGAECALYLDFRDAFAVDTFTHQPTCSMQIVGEEVSGESVSDTDLVVGGRGYGVPSIMQFEQSGRCVIVTVTKYDQVVNGTLIDSRGYNRPCDDLDNPRRLERAVQMLY